jgi:hypothetical protein
MVIHDGKVTPRRMRIGLTYEEAVHGEPEEEGLEH